jgi:unsaturated rhamnogalacturonyl hydrolase
MTRISLLVLWVIFFTTPILLATDAPLTNGFAGSTPFQWSVRMADSEMARRGDSLAWKEGGTAKWDYTTGLFTLSLLKLHERVDDPRYVAFAENAIGSFISTNGAIHGYKFEDYSLDNIDPGRTALDLYQLTKDERYKKAADILRKQLDLQPRTADGGFWHKQRYPHQMWLDGLYMGSPFYAEYAKLFNEPTASFDEVAKQIRLVAAHTHEPKSGLFYHGWDETKEQTWADKTTGASSNFWGRAIGWYAMALVDVLDYFPKDHPARPEIIATLKKLCDGVVKHQDPASGLWWQVMDQGGRPGNYLEASASSMFVYAMAKGVNQGYLSCDYVPAIVKGYKGIIDKLIKTNADGSVSLTQCCSVAGLGGSRDGSFAYYIKEPIVDNDLKGVGPFILAGIEAQPMLFRFVMEKQLSPKLVEKMMRESPILRLLAEGPDYKTETRAFLERIKAKHTAKEIQDWAQKLLDVHKDDKRPFQMPRGETPAFIVELDPPSRPFVTVFPKSSVSIDWGGGFGHWGLMVGASNPPSNSTLYTIEWVPGIYAYQTTQ